MDTEIVAAILIPLFLIFLLCGMPIAIGIGLSSLAAIAVILPVDQIFFQGAQKMFGGIDSFSMLAVPFFMLAGNIMNHGGIARKLINLALMVGGRMPGALAHANVMGNMLFGTLSGSGMACAAAIGGTMAPIQREKGYDPAFSAAINVASGPVGMLIPPSGLLILFSIVSGGVSVAGLFMGGWIPGILWGLAVMAVAYVMAKKYNLPTEKSTLTGGQKFRLVLDSIPALMLIVVVMGGIVGGVFTATEGAAVAVVYSLGLSFYYGNINRKMLISTLMDTAVTTGVILFLVAVSSLMSWIMAYAQIPQMIGDFLLNVTDNKIVLLLIINVALLILGTFMDATPAILIFTPILMPICTQMFGMDPIQFGVMMIFNLGIGNITPPVGCVLFVGAAVGEVKIEKVVPFLIPVFFALVGVLMLVTYIPAVSLFLPRLFGL
ncbi:TRAP transporter large permease [Martelella alba]|uniref:TRAP transporter large permease protein n=1 Tax=Martelella alba TaxID=2590451 RepID=A0A506U9S9_9HYPH|nr:TRAP transporter large permease [Martelella alba]TPW29705.1 TRAP transporter large permease [Martelella alba]